MTEPYLTTARMTLRRPRHGDLDDLDALNRAEGVMRFLDRRPPERAQVAAELARTIRDQVHRPGHGRFIAEDRRTGRFLGWFGLEPGERGVAAPELGYRLRPESWGRGLASEGGRALVAHAFTALGAERVTAQTMAVNTPSRRVMARCGLRYVRTFHEHFDDPLPGTEQGEVWYELTREQWAAESGPRP